MLLNNSFETNVKEHAPPPAGAHSETGVEVQTKQDSADKAAGGGCCASPCSDLLKFLFLRLAYAEKTLEWEKLSDEEKHLASECMFDGKYWPSIVIEEARKAGQPFSDYVVDHVTRIAGGKSNPTPSPQSNALPPC